MFTSEIIITKGCLLVGFVAKILAGFKNLKIMRRRILTASSGMQKASDYYEFVKGKNQINHDL